jgi:hypothetical protein
VTPGALKDVYKNFNEAGEALVDRLKKFREHGVYVLFTVFARPGCARAVRTDAEFAPRPLPVPALLPNQREVGDEQETEQV